MSVTNVWIVDVLYTVAGVSNTVTIAYELQLSPYIPTHKSNPQTTTVTAYVIKGYISPFNCSFSPCFKSCKHVQKPITISASDLCQVNGHHT